ncbi:GNAT family N-acetyltransferase [Methanogenium marinum]|uniref:GNAT family N-acetyltransferase n=1 Tax=Methanogenium marinum TaxID=348610 RepID=A0A9Q4PXN0_9EURY|nr:GNAT family N-acetyltransferase [Methanogenium marinum]MDE4907288.1 GNAT family N-acetyltransferase [Methanogenium marinum]
MNYTIRTLKPTDIRELQFFYIQAYGKDTIFQDLNFLEWFFGGPSFRQGSELNCVVAVNDRDEIVGHLGGILCKLLLNNQPVQLLWAVNAYTLPEYRNLGIGKQLVTLFMNKFDVFGVIGFTYKTAEFYKSQKVNIFGFQRFNRYILNLDEKSFEVVKIIGNDLDKSRKLLNIFESRNIQPIASEDKKVVRINSCNIDNFTIGYTFKENAIVFRDIEYIRWRFINNPYINYSVIAYVIDKKIFAYAIARRERLVPTDLYVTRIVDIYGEDSFIDTVVSKIITDANERRDVYIDFSAFGERYGNILKKIGFICVKDDDVCLFPQVTSPIENRPNLEYFGLYSKPYQERISLMTEEDVYFTRADSDRDRIAKIAQAISKGAE